MLKNYEPIATVAVRDLAVARQFYRDTLGLDLASEDSEVLTFKAGQFQLFVYRSQYAGTNQATAVTWAVGNEVDTIVRDIAAKGVTFEHYQMEGLKLEGDLHVGYGMKVAWFKDPDGNILSVNGM
ncbi:MAG TPA: VOC family protein [Devosiaceae bacterium]|jgi:catechol 2,3-dioxygenase-like lactoylglutathione lyase family enzyme